VQLTDPAGTGAAKKGVLSTVSIGLQGGTRFVSNWLIGNGVEKAIREALAGLVFTASSLALFLSTLWPSTAQSAASKFIARARGRGDDAEINAVTRHLAGRVLLVTGALAVLAPVIWMVLFDGAAWEGLCISAMLITVSTSQFSRGVHFGAGQIARGTKIDLVTSAIGIGGTALLLALGVRNLTLTLPLTVALGVYSLLCWPWTAHGRPDKALRGEIDKFVTFGSAGSIASAGMLQVSQLNTSGISKAAAASYGAALQLVTPMSLITAALTLVLYPSMAEAHGAGDADRLRDQTDLATRSFLAVMLPLLGALAIASRIVIAAWKPDFAAGANALPAFCVALLLQNVASPGVGSITSGPHRNMWYSMLLSWAGFAAAIAAWAILKAPFGIVGIAVGYAIGAALTAVSLLVVAWRLNRQRWRGVFATLTVGVLAIIGLSTWRLSSPPDPLVDVAVAAAFFLATATLALPTVRRLRSARR